MNGGREIPKQKPVVHALEHWRKQPDRTFQNSPPVSMLGLGHVAERFPEGASLITRGIRPPTVARTVTRREKKCRNRC